VIAPRQFSSVKILAPNISNVTLNGTQSSFSREGEYVVVRQSEQLAITVSAAARQLAVPWKKESGHGESVEPNGQSHHGKSHTQTLKRLAATNRESVDVVGGIVNLIATNKGPVERKIFPVDFSKDAKWINGISSIEKQIPPGNTETFLFNIEVPNNAAPVTYPALISFGETHLPSLSL